MRTLKRQRTRRQREDEEDQGHAPGRIEKAFSLTRHGETFSSGNGQSIPMGCGSSRTTAISWDKRLSGSTVASLEAKNCLPDVISKHYGHPSLDKGHGYDFGIRVRVRGNKISLYVASSKSDGRRVTLKECHLQNYPERNAVHEIYVLADLSHESLPALRSIFITDASLFLIMDYMDPARLKNFVDWKKHKTSLATNDVKDIFRALVTAVQYVHEKKYIIRNLIPDNIMLRKDIDKYKIKITDLSYAVPIGSTETLADHPLFDWGDVPFTSPEALLGPSYNHSMDLWSLGVLLYLMLTSYLPFFHEDDKTLVHTIKMAAYSYDINSPVDENARELITNFLRPDPSDRISTKETLKFPWLFQL